MHEDIFSVSVFDDISVKQLVECTGRTKKSNP